MRERIALVTAGGHIAPFHSAMKSMYETLEEKAKGRFELVGAKGGLTGLANGNFIPIHYNHLDPDMAGSLIGADRKIADTKNIIRSIKDNGIYAVVMMGGDNHLGEARRLHEEGIRIVGYPKTMDGDLSSNITLGWDTAVTVGAMQTRYHHVTAMTYNRVFFVGLFGRNTDWVTAAVGAYGGADVTIPCEKGYSLSFVMDKIKQAFEINKERYGAGFAVVPYSEGAKIEGISPPPDQHRSNDAHGLPKLQPEWLGLELVRVSKDYNMGAAFQAHTYDMRDSPPTHTDKLLSSWAGVGCIDMILEGDFGRSVIFVPSEDGFYVVDRAPLEKVAVQRFLSPTGYFDYEGMKTDPSFIKDYGNLFRGSLGDVPKKDDLVFKNMLG